MSEEVMHERLMVVSSEVMLRLGDKQNQGGIGVPFLWQSYRFNNGMTLRMKLGREAATREPIIEARFKKEPDSRELSCTLHLQPGNLAGHIHIEGVDYRFGVYEVEPCDVHPEVMDYAVIGRVIGDDEDTCHVIMARSRFEAVQEFESRMWEEVSSEDCATFFNTYKEWVYINHVLRAKKLTIL